MAFQKINESEILLTFEADGSVSNNSLWIMKEMKVSALNAKIQSNSSKAGNSYDVYKVVTENGVKAFGIDTGVIEEGKLAVLSCMIWINYLMMPKYILISKIVYFAQNINIIDVFLNLNKYNLI